MEQRRVFPSVPDGAEFERIDVEREDAHEPVVVRGVGFEREGNAIAGGDAADESLGRRGGTAEARREAAEPAELGDKRAVAGSFFFVEADPRLVGEVDELQDRFLGARMPGGQHDHQARPHDEEGFEFAHAAEHGTHDEPDVGATRAERGELVVKAQVAQRDLGAGELAVELGHHGRQELAGDAPVVADDQLAGAAADSFVSSGDGDVDLGENLAGVRVENASGVGELHAMIAREERCAEFLLERANLPAERGLGDAEAFGGTAEVELFGDGFEVAQMAELH